jgi:hypothetical protein
MTKRPKIGPRARGSKSRQKCSKRGIHHTRTMTRSYPRTNTISKTQPQPQPQPEPDCELQSQKNNEQLVVAPPENGPTLNELFQVLNKEGKWGGGGKTRKTKKKSKKLNRKHRTNKKQKSKRTRSRK